MSCIRIPYEVYDAIEVYREDLQRRDYMKVLLGLFGDILPYEQLLKYIDYKDAIGSYRDKD